MVAGIDRRDALSGRAGASLTREAAQKAIDEAFAEGLKNLFIVLERNIIGQSIETATREFEAGVAKFDQAHTTATAIIDKIFKE